MRGYIGSILIILFTGLIVIAICCKNGMFEYKARLLEDNSIVPLKTDARTLMEGDTIWVMPSNDDDNEFWHLAKPDSAYKAVIAHTYN